jgi:hypothetical protein
VGVYVGTAAATAHSSTEYDICVGGIAYVIPIEDHADVTINQIVFAQNDGAGYAGYSEFADTIGTANHNAEVGHTLYASAKVTFTGTTGVDPDTDTITLSSDPTTWAVNDPVVFWDSADAAVPTGMTDGLVYWIKTKSGADVTLSATRGGTTLDITADGDGTTMYLQKLPKAILHWN